MSMPSELSAVSLAAARKRAHVLVIEDSRTFSSLLCHRFETEHVYMVTHCAATKALRDAAGRTDLP
ncbi:MAG: hypothetical protein K0M47_14660, partial [Rhizobium sp.]|nr:hypothetical protein [Rhizobium sp.]